MFKTLVVPLDGGMQTDAVIALARRSCVAAAATIHLLCVIDASYLVPTDDGDGDGRSVDGLEYPPATAEHWRAEQILAMATVELSLAGVAVTTHIRPGHPSEVIVQLARDVRADVIVMGHEHLSRIRRWLTPSTAGEVIEQAGCPVLIAASPAA